MTLKERTAAEKIAYLQGYASAIDAAAHRAKDYVKNALETWTLSEIIRELPDETLWAIDKLSPKHVLTPPEAP
jgi:hypothetical protein